MTTPWVPGDSVRVECALCPAAFLGPDAIVDHLVEVHGQPEPERWPDGTIAMDASGIADDVTAGWGGV